MLSESVDNPLVRIHSLSLTTRGARALALKAAKSQMAPHLSDREAHLRIAPNSELRRTDIQGNI